MINGFFYVVLALSLAAIPKGLWRGENGSIRFESDAPLELITARTDQLQGLIDPSKNTFAFSVPTGSFEGFNSPLQQEHFHENYIESSKYPTASFAGKFIENIESLEEGLHTVRAKGMLKIHGEVVERIIKCEMLVKDDEIQVTSQFSVPLSDHKITIPQVVHQKIAEEIYVDVQITMTQQ